jgi:hydroxyacyl-ACP dehydratase HTD2-like protein with hotdog domain
MLDSTKTIQGYATYYEYARSGETIQIIFTPDGYTTYGSYVPACVLRRQIYTHKEKRRWVTMRLKATTSATETITDTDTYVTDRIKYISDNTFKHLQKYSELHSKYKLVNTVVVVEVSKKDLDDIASRKTPTKVIHRINQSRIAMKFPTKLINVKEVV